MLISIMQFLERGKNCSFFKCQVRIICSLQLEHYCVFIMLLIIMIRAKYPKQGLIVMMYADYQPLKTERYTCIVSSQVAAPLSLYSN